MASDLKSIRRAAAAAVPNDLETHLRSGKHFSATFTTSVNEEGRPLLSFIDHAGAMRHYVVVGENLVLRPPTQTAIVIGFDTFLSTGGVR